MAERKASPISDGIRAAIRASGRSVYSIAKQVECSPQQLYNFLGGKRCLSQDLLDALGDALELEVTGRPGGAGRTGALIAPSLPDAPEPEVAAFSSEQFDSDPVEPGPSPDATPPVPPAQTPPVLPKSGGLTKPGNIDLDKIRKYILRARGAGGEPKNRMSPDDVRRAFAKPGVISGAFIGGPRTGEYNPEKAATRVEEPRFNSMVGGIKKMLKLWGPGVEAFYKAQGRDTPAKDNIYTFLCVLSRTPATRKYLEYIKKFPMPKILDWVQAFTPEQQLQIAAKLPFLDDEPTEGTWTINTRFWERVDQDSFFKAVERLGFLPAPELKAKYIDRKARTVPNESRDSDEPGDDDPSPD